MKEASYAILAGVETPAATERRCRLQCGLSGVPAPGRLWGRIRGRRSKALLAFLFRHIEMPEFACRFRWERDSVAFWDNQAAQHHALWDHYPHSRSGTRVMVMGDWPFHWA